LYNHSSDPNAEYELQLAADVVVFRALRDIGPGEEVTISYSDDSDLWFVPRGDGARSLTRSASNGRTSGRRRAATEETGDGSSTARRKR
jgi:SET domain-containing protein